MMAESRRAMSKWKLNRQSGIVDAKNSVTSSWYPDGSFCCPYRPMETLNKSVPQVSSWMRIASSSRIR
jgi:hypothetical protein